MFGSVGAPEIILIFIVALLIFGPRKLPELGRVLGRTLSDFRKATTELKSTLEQEVAVEENSTERVPESSGTPSVPPPETEKEGGGNGGRNSS